MKQKPLENKSVPIPRTRPPMRRSSPSYPGKNPGKKTNPRRQFSYPGNVPAKKPGKETIDKPGQKQNKGVLQRLNKAKSLVLYIAFFAAGLLLVAQSAYISQMNYQIIQHENRLESIYNQRNYLEMKILEKKSPERLEKIATQNLKMENPSEGRIIHIE